MAKAKEIEQIYKTMLKRNPDKEGLSYWQSQVESGKDIDWVRNAIANTDEYKQKNASNSNSFLGNNDYRSMLEGIYKTRAEQEARARQLANRQSLARTLQGLRSSKGNIQSIYSQALNRLKEQYNQQKPVFQQQRNQTSVDAAKAAQRIAEIMGATGRYDSGDNVTAQVANNTAMQNLMNAINQQEGQFETSYTNRTSEINQNLANAIKAIEDQIALAATQGAEYDRSIAEALQANLTNAQRQALIDAQNYGLDVAGLTGYLNGTPTMAMRQFEHQRAQDALRRAMQEASLTGYYNGNPTFDRERWRTEFDADQSYRNAQLALQRAYRARNTQDDQPKLNYTPEQASNYETFIKDMNNKNYDDLYKMYVQVTGPTSMFTRNVLGDDLYNDYVNRLKQRMDEIKKYRPSSSSGQYYPIE